MINKTAEGNWRVRVKHKGAVVADRTFTRKADAEIWESNQKRLLLLGDFIDPRLGLVPLKEIAERWLAIRAKTRAGKTYQTDESMIRNHLDDKTARLPIGSIRTSDIDALLWAAHETISLSSIGRFRAVLSALFAWAVREQMIKSNPVLASRIPTGTGEEEVQEVDPFSATELFEVHSAAYAAHGKWADLILVLGLSGIRWGELTPLRPRDIQMVPYPAIRVTRSAPDGQAIRNKPKGGKARTVPIAAELLPIFQEWMRGKATDELIFANSAGNRIDNSNWTRNIHWRQVGRGRRVHDLRHTAATLWLSSGVDPKTVQTWLGHASMKQTFDTYTHYMGRDADVSAISRINSVLQSERDRSTNGSDANEAASGLS